MTAQAKPKQARSLLKRSAMIEAGQAEFSQRGYAGTTSKSIAERAGVATGSFYQHFANKDELLHEIGRQRVAVLLENLKALKAQEVADSDAAPDHLSAEEILKNSLAFIYDFHRQNPELHQVMEERRHLDPELEEILNDGEAALEQRVLQFVQSFNVASPEVVASNLFGMAEGLVHRHVFGVKSHDPQDVINQGAKMLVAFFNQTTSNSK